MTPKHYLLYDDEKLQLVNQTVSHYLYKQRNRGTAVLDKDIMSEISNLEGVYYKLTRNTGISEFKSTLKTKWDAIYVFLLSI